MKIYLFTLVSLIVLLFTSSDILSQTCGDVTLTTQAQVNDFKCTRIEGSLTIDGGGSSNITSLEAIFNNGMNGGAVVTGNVSVVNCPGLVNLDGLDGIGDIGGWFVIVDNPNLQSFGQYGFQLAKIGGAFSMANCPKFNDLSKLSFLKNSSAILFTGNSSIKDFSIFNNLTNCDLIQFNSTNVTNINGFNSIQSTAYISIVANSNLTSITGFNALTKIASKTVLGNPQNVFHFVDNNSLSNISGFTNLNTVDETSIIIKGNSQLATCCFATEILASNPGSVDISNNAQGCNSLAQVDAPPTLGTCPSDRTVFTTPGSCLATTSAVSPTVSDNCDLANFGLSFLLPDNSIQNIANAPINSQINFSNLSLGTTMVSFVARDNNGNQSSCSFNVTVEDNVQPTLSNIPSNVTINCDDPFPSIPTPLVSDNCDGNAALSATSSISMGSCMLGEPAEITSYTWTATDASGNSRSQSWQVTRISDFSFDLGSTVNACNGSTYLIDPGVSGGNYVWSTGAQTPTLTVSNSGTYRVTITTASGCCYADEVDVTFENPPNATATGGTLSCNTSTVQIMGSSTTAGVTYSWTGPGGFTSNAQNPMVSSTGTYTLTVSTSANCTATATTEVMANNELPNVSASGGVLSCEVTSVQLTGNSTTTGASFSWTGPANYSSNSQNPTVTEPGIYTLTVAGTNGCSASVNVEVTGDLTLPELNVNDGVLDCNNTSLSYSVTGGANWQGPEGFTSTENEVELVMVGTYSVTVTGNNGCTSTQTFEVSDDLSIPDVSAEGARITCNSLGDTIKGFSMTENVDFLWTGPNGFTANFSNPIAVSLGTYTLQVTGSNGCTATVDVEVVSGDEAPILETMGDTIDCIKTSAELSVTASQEELTYAWTGPDGFTAEGDRITVTSPGSYTVVGTNTDGCSGVGVVEVADNTQAPEVMIVAPSLSCQEGPVFIAAESSSIIISYNWSGPEGFASNLASPEINTAGEYTLEATGENGCVAIDVAEVTSDIENPDAIAEGGTLSCSQNSLVINGSSTTEGASYQWSGPDDFISNLQNPTISVIGEYVLTVIAPNGCTATDTLIIEGDSDLPSIGATGGTIDCLNESITLMGFTESQDVSTTWEGPNGFFSTERSPNVDIAGLYTFTVTSASGCQVFLSVEVDLDLRVPDIQISPGFVFCDEGEAEFNVNTNALDGQFMWTGPDGYTSDLFNAIYSEAGTYTLTIIDDNGCSSQSSIEIESDVNYDVNLMISDNSAEVEIIGGTPPFEIIFEGAPEGSSVSGLSIGDHSVTVKDGLGCVKVIDFTILTSAVDDEDISSDISVFPNPVSDQITVNWLDTGMDFGKLYILSTDGAILRKVSTSGNKITIDQLSQLSEGLYLIRLEGSDHAVTKKFLILR